MPTWVGILYILNAHLGGDIIYIYTSKYIIRTTAAVYIQQQQYTRVTGGIIDQKVVRERNTCALHRGPANTDSQKALGRDHTTECPRGSSE